MLLQLAAAADCITARRKAFAEATKSPSESNERMLDLIGRFGNAEVHGRIHRLSGKDRTRNVVTRSTKFSSGSWNETRNALFNSSKSVALETKCSVGADCFCQSFVSFQNLCELYTSGKLRPVREDLFTLLLDEGRSVKVKHLCCMETPGLSSMHMSRGLWIDAEVYQLAGTSPIEVPQTVKINGRREDASMHVEALPLEVLESGKLFTIVSRLIPEVAACAMATTCAVSE
jgi:hypothetical protein